AAHESKYDADNTHDDRGKGGNTGDCGHRPRDIAKQAMRAAGKYQFLSFLRSVSFDDANAAQRLSQTPRDFRIDLTALTKQRSEFLESQRHGTAKRSEGYDDYGS